MELTKENLQALYDTMSLTELARHLNIAKSTLYYYMKKFGIERRSKSLAQLKHVKDNGHQRIGKTHTLESKIKISNGTQEFWDSKEGQDQKQKLADIRIEEWHERSSKQRSSILARLQEAHRPRPGELSKFGIKLKEFLSKRENVSSGIRLTPHHVSDIILEDRKIVIELVLPIGIYGEEQSNRFHKRYDRIISQLNAAGYRVMIIEDKSNSVSYARCKRIYSQLLEFNDSKSLPFIRITS